MQLASTAVGILPCAEYDRQEIKVKLDKIMQSLSFSIGRGSRVMLKPNLISAGNNGLPCTHPEVVAALAEWLVDHGAQVTVGDSPAFGSAKKVMQRCGMMRAIQKLPIRLINFKRYREIHLRRGYTVKVAADLLDSDIFMNVPKLKAHSQLMITGAVKNCFGAVVGLQKPLIHAKYGDVHNRFEELLVGLLDILPDGVSLLDGIIAMHETGPIHGKPCHVGLLAGSINPVALDTAMIKIVGCDFTKSPLWYECNKQGLTGSNPEDLVYPLCKPEEIGRPAFTLPDLLKPITFHPGKLFTGAIKRIIAQV